MSEQPQWRSHSTAIDSRGNVYRVKVTVEIAPDLHHSDALKEMPACWNVQPVVSGVQNAVDKLLRLMADSGFALRLCTAWKQSQAALRRPDSEDCSQ